MKIEFLDGTILIHKFYSGDELFDVSHSGVGFDAYYDTDYKATVIDRYNTDGRTAKIEERQFIKILVLLYEKRPFTRLKFINYYPRNENEIMEEVKKQIDIDIQ